VKYEVFKRIGLWHCWCPKHRTTLRAQRFADVWELLAEHNRMRHS
jgi:hypothetical protein